jgi:2-desacetyl-2-hydroxyethyl bacteriochlorophyllide A dehydrogenase
MLLAPNQMVMEEAELEKVQSGQILVKNVAGSISTGTELTCLTTTFPADSRYLTWIKYPFPLGYGASGVVVEVGEGVEGFKAGDRVAHGAGHASYNLLQTKGNSNLYKVPEGLSDEEASFWHLARTSLNAVRLGEITVGDCVVVAGLGIIGQFAAQFAKLSGADPLIAMDLADGRLAMAKATGADISLNPTQADARQSISKLSSGRGADLLFDATGSPKALGGLLRMVKEQGKVVLTGSPIGDTSVNMNEDVVWKKLKLIGAHESAQDSGDNDRTPWGYKRNGEMVLDFMKRGRLQVKPLITHRFAGPDLPKAYEFLKTDRTQAVGVVLNWS